MTIVEEVDAAAQGAPRRVRRAPLRAQSTRKHDADLRGRSVRSRAGLLQTPKRNPAPVPWTIGHLVTLCAAYVVAGAAIAGSWFVMSQREVADSQVAPMAIGAIGCAVGLLAGPLWVMAGRRAVGIRLGAALDRIDAGDGQVEQEAPERAAAGGLVATEAMRHFHRPDCELVRGKSATRRSEREHRARGRVPCQVCIS